MSNLTRPPATARSARRRTASVAAAGGMLLVLALAMLVSVSPASAALRTFTGVSLAADGSGYVLMSDAGEAYAFGMPYRGNPHGFTGRIVGVSATAGGQGYAAVSSSGQVYAYGNVAYHGNPTGFSGEIAGISVTADGSGYVIVSSAGQVYAYNVPYHGNAIGFTGRITGVSLTASGSGYHLVSSAGQVYAFNSAYHGNPEGFTGEIVSISSTADGSGYYAISSIGQVYAYGTQYHGNPAGFTGQIVGISSNADGSGYVALSSSGQVYAYNVAYQGNGDPGAPDAPAAPDADAPTPQPGSPAARGPLTQAQIRKNNTAYGACTARGGKVTCTNVRLVNLQLPASFAMKQRTVRVNAEALGAFQAVVGDIDRAGLGSRIHSLQTVNPRQCKNARTGRFIPNCTSMHSWGVAVDVNPDQFSAMKDGQPLAGVRKIFLAHGFTWGNTFKSNPDPPHFQYAST